jgi:ATP-dependent DNA ligase
VVLGVDGISDFAALYSRKHDEEVQFYAFDMLAGEGDDMRSLPLSLRKAQPCSVAGASQRRHLHCPFRAW